MESLNIIVSKEDAIRNGLKHYFTGIPCKHGHLSERYVSTGICKQCGRGRKEYLRVYNAENKVAIRQKQREYRANNADHLAACKRKYRIDNAEKIKYGQQGYRAKNQDKIKTYLKSWYVENKSKHSARCRQYRAENADALAEKKKKYRAENVEAISESQRQWRILNPAKKAALGRKYLASKLKRTPAWLTEAHYAEIRSFYDEAARLTKETGISHHVDHVQPLCGKRSSGLHVPWNLQVLTWRENLSKGNREL